jgi:hypothetical protein
VIEAIHDRTSGPVHGWFELTYSNYLVLPRVLMQSMPVEWQERMVACLEEVREAFRDVEQAPGYKVESVEWEYPEDLGTSQREALGIAYNEDADEYYDAVGNVVQGCSVPVPAREPLPHYRHGYVEPRDES